MEQEVNAPKEGAQQGETQQQNAQADLSKLVGQAKNATQGFDFMKMFEGRIGHTQFLYFLVAGIIASLIFGMIPVIGWIASIALGVVGIGVGIRRFHDIDMVGWMVLVFFVPFVGLLVALYLCWKHGNPAANAYGPVPDPKRDFFKAILNT